MKRSEVWGVRYVMPDEAGLVLEHGPRDRYAYRAVVRGPVTVRENESAFAVFSREAPDDPVDVQVMAGGTSVNHVELAVSIPGVLMEEATRRAGKATYLPYVNGCSTKQLFPPDRLGDPTLQYLDIPPYSAEQAHHIHSTARVVYILDGQGDSVVGMDAKVERTTLVPGMVCVLDPMCPHHFETPYGKNLVCLPVHVWSSVGAAEYNHPMFAGTHLMNQGAS